MTKLHQILALEKGIKSKKDKAATAAYQLFQNGQTFFGISRTYHPRDDEGEVLPAEVQGVQSRVSEQLESVSAAMSAALDLMVTKDIANTRAVADIVVDGVSLAEGVPVTTLLSLEKTVGDIRTMALAIPTLDPTYKWEFDEAADAYRSEPRMTTRTKKVPTNHVLAEATKEHPAQVQLINNDVIVGDWETTNFSGAIPASEKKEMVERIENVLKAVKVARQNANDQDAPNVEMAHELMEYMFHG